MASDGSGACPLSPSRLGEQFATALIAQVHAVHSGAADREPLSVRELLSLRAGRLYTSRAATRVLRANPHPEVVAAPAGPAFGEVRRRRKQRHKDSKEGKDRRSSRDRRRKRRRGSSSSDSRHSSRSSTGSSSVSESHERLFRGARDLGSYATRAQKQAVTNPDRVLLETIAELLALLPAARPGASSTVGGGYEAAQSLPSLFVPYHAQILSAKLSAGSSQGSNRNERESRTLCEILDTLLQGRTLNGIMVALARLKAIEASVEPATGGWAFASQHELIGRPGQGLVSQRDRTLAIRDQRDEQRSRVQRGLPGVDKGKGRGRRRE